MRMWPSERGWARRSPGVSSGSQLPSAPLPRSLKVRSIMDLRGEGRRPGRAVSNGPAGFKEMLDMAGEYPSSLTGAGCAQGGATLGSMFITGMEDSAPHLFSVLSSPCRNPHPFAHRGKEEKKHQPQGPYPAPLVQIHPSLKPNCPISAQSAWAQILTSSKV